MTTNTIGDTQLSYIYHVNVHDEHFVVCILHMSCCRLIQPVKMYVIWYMMWYLEKDMFSKEHDRFRCFSVGLAILRCPADKFHMELDCAFARILHAREIYDRVRDCI